MLLLIAGAIFFSQSGFVVWQSLRTICYHYLRTHHREEIITISINKENLEKEIVWIKKDEVRYKGKMFDIKQQSETDTSLLFTGHFDSKDDKLFKWLKHLVEEKHEHNKSKHKFSFWFFDATVSSSYGIYSFCWKYIKQQQTSPRTSFYTSCIIENISPPPEYSNSLFIF